MQLYFIRHGQSINNALWDATQSSDQFHVDPLLTDIGRQQASALGRCLAINGSPSVPSWDPQNTQGYQFTHLYTSLMLRAVQTSMILAEALAMHPIGWIDLHEHGGLADRNPDTGEDHISPGENRDYFSRNAPGLILPDSLGENGWWNQPEESVDAGRERGKRVLSEIIERHAGTEHRVALVSHGGFYNFLLAAIFNVPSIPGWWFLMNNTAVTRIDFDPHETRLSYANRVDHLYHDLIT